MTDDTAFSDPVHAWAVLHSHPALSWTPPTQNDDGTVLTDLTGYEVRYGTNQANLDRSVQVTNPSVNTFVVDSLTSGTWFFAIRSINSSGNGSVMSNVASKTIS